MDLKINEIFIVTALRIFYNFLIKKKYQIVSLTYCDRDGDYIQFLSIDEKNEIIIDLYSFSNSWNIDIVFNKKLGAIFSKKKTFSLSKIFKIVPKYSTFQTKVSVEDINEKMKIYFDFIEKHLQPILTGDMWIDELYPYLKKLH